jgi:hypothetical protein
MNTLDMQDLEEFFEMMDEAREEAERQVLADLARDGMLKGSRC